MSEQNIEKEQLYKGVFRAEKKDGTVYYRASLTKNGKHISLGSFPDALQAHRAYEQGLLLLSDPSLTLQSYEKVSPLSFEKWLSLINLRDNDYTSAIRSIWDSSSSIIICPPTMS